MRKLIAVMNMTLDGFCDHTSGIANDEIHDHYTELLKNGEIILYGRKTFRLMEYWRSVLENPTGNKAFDDFAVAIDNIHKIVFSRTLENVEWKTAELKRDLDKDEIELLKEQPGKPIFVGSPSIIVQLGNLGLIDEYQLAVNPIVAASGLALFKNINGRIDLDLLQTKTFGCGVVIHYYRPTESRA